MALEPRAEGVALESEEPAAVPDHGACGEEFRGERAACAFVGRIAVRRKMRHALPTQTEREDERAFRECIGEKRRHREARAVACVAGPSGLLRKRARCGRAQRFSACEEPHDERIAEKRAFKRRIRSADDRRRKRVRRLGRLRRVRWRARWRARW